MFDPSGVVRRSAEQPPVNMPDGPDSLWLPFFSGPDNCYPAACSRRLISRLFHFGNVLKTL